MSATATPKVFISYRREETAGHAGRLYDAMVARMGEGHVFVDVDLAPGIDFVERITEAVGACRVLLVIMGPRWAEIADGEGGPRIADPEDFVRLEVETALRRPDVTVIPVLVGGAQMPDPDDLPEGVRPLTRRNAIELSDMRWRYDVGRLHATLDELLVETPGVHETTAAASETGSTGTHETGASGVQTVPATAAPPTTRISPTARLLIEGMLVAGVAALLARWLADPIDPQSWDTDEGKVLGTMLRRAVSWGLLGAALAAWLSFVRGEVRLMASRGGWGLVIGAAAGALGGAIGGGAQYLPETPLTREEIDSVSIGAFAASGSILGGLLGALWSPRRVAAGFFAGLGAGALVRLFWIQIDQQNKSAFDESFEFGVQCLLIVGLLLAALLLLSRSSSTAPAAGETAKAV